MTRPTELKTRWQADRDFSEAYAALEEEFAIARSLIEARTRAGLSQAQLAERMGTKQANIARMESGGYLPSTRSLLRYAAATQSKLEIALKPAG